MAIVTVQLMGGVGISEPVHRLNVPGRPKIVAEDGMIVLGEVAGTAVHFVAAFPRDRVVSVVVDEFRAGA